MPTDTSDAPRLPPGGPVELPGRGTTFAREVEGPPGAPVLVLLHGLGVSADVNWFTAYETLGRDYRVLALDHRGHGRGIRDGNRFRLADCADDAVALCDVLGIERFTAVGYSMGGPIAQLTWHRHRERLDGIVLCATAGRFAGFEPVQGIAGGLVRRFASAAANPGRGRRLTRDEALNRWMRSELRLTDPRASVQAGLALARYDPSRWLGEVDVPTAVVLTERDGAVPPSRQRRLASAIPGATVHPVDGDHTCCVTRPSRFVPALLDACRDVHLRVATTAR
jgi:pimeloyl-ACP methyl ester carboxylesterase